MLAESATLADRHVDDSLPTTLILLLIAIAAIAALVITTLIISLLPALLPSLLSPLPAILTTVAATSALILEIRRAPSTVGIVLILPTIVIIIHLLGTSLCALLRLVTIPRVLALRLGEPVHLAADKACEQLLGEAVGNLLAFLALVVFEELHAFEGGGAGDQFV
jgi:hypothetical protein